MKIVLSLEGNLWRFLMMQKKEIWGPGQIAHNAPQLFHNLWDCISQSLNHECPCVLQVEDAMLMFDKTTNRHRGKEGNEPQHFLTLYGFSLAHWKKQVCLLWTVDGFFCVKQWSNYLYLQPPMFSSGTLWIVNVSFSLANIIWCLIIPQVFCNHPF